MNKTTKWALVGGLALVVLGAFLFSSSSSSSRDQGTDKAPQAADGQAGGTGGAGPAAPGRAGGGAPGGTSDSPAPGSVGAGRPGAPGVTTGPLAGRGPGSDPRAGPGGPGRPTAALASSPSDPQRVMPYRPAHLLRYSEIPAGHNRTEDDTSPVLARILDVTKPDPDQRKQIEELWHQHEDGRRALLAKALPRMSGPPILDEQKLRELDFMFEGPLLGKVLRPDQGARLSQEIYPPK